MRSVYEGGRFGGNVRVVYINIPCVRDVGRMMMGVYVVEMNVAATTYLQSIRLNLATGIAPHATEDQARKITVEFQIANHNIRTALNGDHRHVSHTVFVIDEMSRGRMNFAGIFVESAKTQARGSFNNCVIAFDHETVQTFDMKKRFCFIIGVFPFLVVLFTDKIRPFGEDECAAAFFLEQLSGFLKCGRIIADAVAFGTAIFLFWHVCEAD